MDRTQEIHSVSPGKSWAICGRAGTSMISMNMTIMAKLARMARIVPFARLYVLLLFSTMGTPISVFDIWLVISICSGGFEPPLERDTVLLPS